MVELESFSNWRVITEECLQSRQLIIRSKYGRLRIMKIFKLERGIYCK